MSLFEDVNAGIKAAMKARDKQRLEALKGIKAEFLLIKTAPENNGEVIRISIPPLTEERRKALVKQSKNEAEQAKISVRNARRDAIEGLKKAIKDGMPEDVEKDAEAKVQKIHDRFMKRIDEIFAAKEKEILTV